MKPHEPITLQEVYQARDRIKDAAIRTPLVRLNVESRGDIALMKEKTSELLAEMARLDQPDTRRTATGAR